MMSFEFPIWPIGSFEWCLDSKDYHSLQEQHDLYIRTHVLVETVEKAERQSSNSFVIKLDWLNSALPNEL